MRRAQAPQGAGKALLAEYLAADAELGVLEPGSGECRLWPYGQSTGYGHVKGFRTKYVHRLILEAHAGQPYVGICEITGKLALKDHAAHSCENKHCCAVDGTDNRGEKSVLSKLTESDVLEIRARYATGLISQRGLAEEYGLAQSQISRIVNRERWAHI